MKIAFLGLGQMGSAIARNLINANHDVTVYNRTSSRAEEFRKLAKVAESPADAAKTAEVALSMLADDTAVSSIVFGENGILNTLPAGSVHISLSTISVALSRQLADAHCQKNQHYLSAPVFGRPDAAAAAKLFTVVAGPKNQIERCQPIFDAIGQKTFEVGDQAHLANVVKLTGNFMITAVIESLAESLALVAKAGLNQQTFLEVMTGSLFGAPIYKNYGSIIAEQKFEPAGFKLPLGLKDNKLVLACAEENSVPLPLASLVHDRFVNAMAQGWSEQDWSAISRLAMRDAGLE